MSGETRNVSRKGISVSLYNDNISVAVKDGGISLTKLQAKELIKQLKFVLED